MGRKVELVGTSEAAAILGVEKPRIGRYVKAKRMPPVVAELHATKLWLKKDIEDMRDGKKLPTHRKVLDLVGTREAAELLGVERTRIGRWKKAGKMPTPVVELNSTPVWWEEDVRAMLAGLEERRRPRHQQA